MSGPGSDLLAHLDGWDRLHAAREQRSRRRVNASQQGEKIDTRRREAVTAAGALANPRGRRLLDYLKSISLDRALPPDASDGELRHLEGQRFIVRHLLTLCDQAKRPVNATSVPETPARPTIPG